MRRAAEQNAGTGYQLALVRSVGGNEGVRFLARLGVLVSFVLQDLLVRELADCLGLGRELLPEGKLVQIQGFTTSVWCKVVARSGCSSLPFGLLAQVGGGLNGTTVSRCCLCAAFIILSGSFFAITSPCSDRGSRTSWIPTGYPSRPR